MDCSLFFFFQAEDGIRDFCLSRGLGDVYKRQVLLQTYDGVKILCNRENVPDLSSSGMEKGADLRVTFNPAKSRTSNIYTCIKFEDP